MSTPSQTSGVNSPLTPQEVSASPRPARTESGRMAGFFRALVLWISVASTTVFFSSFVLFCFPFVYPFDKERHSLHAIAIVWSKTILFLNPWWKFEIVGHENLPPNGRSVVYVANHNSQTDILAMFMLGVRFRWLSKDAVFKVPLLGWAMHACGYVSVTRGDKGSHSRCMDESKRHLERGTSMVFFPEGTRSRDGVMQVFKSGAFRIAVETKAPVVPVTLSGTATLLPKGSAFPSVTEVKIVVHPPISSEGKSVDAVLREASEAVASALPESQRQPQRRMKVRT
jgi:1-acyl-sn-glycerol-3-phosphate acyltransferase